MGFSVFESFAEEFGHRFVNVGISEANMIGVASGLAMSEKKVVVYSIVPFVTMRCFEQIRNDLCYPNINVTLVGVGGGLSYGPAGPTHHAIEDIAIMRSLPNMKVVCPGDPFEAENAVEQALEIGSPVYVRLNRDREPRLYDERIGFRIGVANKLREGKDISLLATGNMLEESIEIAKGLVVSGFDVKLVSMHTIKPIDEVIIRECINSTKAIFTIEEHNVIGGLGSAVSEIITKNMTRPIVFKAYGIPDVYADSAGSTDYLRKLYRIDKMSIMDDIKELLDESKCVFWKGW